MNQPRVSRRSALVILLFCPQVSAFRQKERDNA